jgi:hypothetical protein
MAKKRSRRTRSQLSGISLAAVDKSITQVEKRIRALRVTRSQQIDKDAAIKFCTALKDLLKSICSTSRGRFIPFFMGKDPF